ncbi:MAG: VanZ family protein [Bacteroidota bacterium]
MSELDEVSISPALWKKPFLSHWLPLILWMGVIFYLSDQDKNQTVQTSGFVLWLLSFLPLDPEWLTSPAFKVFVRKSAHMTEYFFLYLWAFRLLNWYQPFQIAWNWAAFLSIAYAMTDEFHQTFVPGRGASIRDVGVDSLGVCLGMIIIWVFLRPSRAKIT